MNSFALNLLLAGAWMLLSSSFGPFAFLSGYALGFIALWLLQPIMGGRNRYFTRVLCWIRLVVMFHYELIVSSVVVAWDVLTPRHRARPALVTVPLDVETDAGIFLVTNLISLTPGTLSIDVSEDRRTLTVHAMFADDPDALRHQLKSGMERWVRAAVEGP